MRLRCVSVRQGNQKRKPGGAFHPECLGHITQRGLGISPIPVSRSAMARYLTAQRQGVPRAKVYGSDRRVLRSSDAQLIGRQFADNDELRRAL